MQLFFYQAILKVFVFSTVDEWNTPHSVSLIQSVPTNSITLITIRSMTEYIRVNVFLNGNNFMPNGKILVTLTVSSLQVVPS